MNFVISKEKFANALQIVSRAISPNSPVPSLSGVKITVSQKGVTLLGSNNDVTIQLTLSNESDPDNHISVIEEGEVVIDQRYVYEIVRKSDQENIIMEVIDGTLIRISDGVALFNINGYRVSDYPRLDLTVPPVSFEIKAETLHEVIDQTIFATSQKETQRPILFGVNFKSTGEQVIVTATDSYRLAKKILDLKTDEFNVTISSKVLNDIHSIFSPSENLKIFLNQSKIQVLCDNLLLQARLLEGSYPDTDRLIPTQFTRTLVVNRRELMRSIDYSSFMKVDNMAIIRLSMKNENEVSVKNKSQEIGDYNQDLKPIQFEGEPMDISFSSQYMLDAAKSIHSETVMIQFTQDMRPFILRNPEDDTILQLVLPVKTYN